jgi:hypothetical protein
LDAFLTRCENWLWDWEKHRKTALRTLQNEDTDSADILLRAAMPHVYDFQSIDMAPVNVILYVEQNGGIREGQRVYCAPCGDGHALVALWWPWGDGCTVSLRVGVAGQDTNAINERFQARLSSS